MTDLLLPTSAGFNRPATILAGLLAPLVHRARVLRRLLALRRHRRQLALWRHLADADEHVQCDLGVDARRLRNYDWMADLMRH